MLQLFSNVLFYFKFHKYKNVFEIIFPVPQLISNDFSKKFF